MKNGKRSNITIQKNKIKDNSNILTLTICHRRSRCSFHFHSKKVPITPTNIFPMIRIGGSKWDFWFIWRWVSQVQCWNSNMKCHFRDISLPIVKFQVSTRIRIDSHKLSSTRGTKHVWTNIRHPWTFQLHFDFKNIFSVSPTYHLSKSMQPTIFLFPYFHRFLAKDSRRWSYEKEVMCQWKTMIGR